MVLFINCKNRFWVTAYRDWTNRFALGIEGDPFYYYYGR